MPLERHPGLLEMPRERLGRVLLLGIGKTELHSLITIPAGRLLLNYGARPRLNHGHRNDLPVLREYLRHADLSAY
jgi:hypothetical protein